MSLNRVFSTSFSPWMLVGALVIGCSPPVQKVPPDGNPSFGPHGGPVVPLPGDLGYVEISQEPTSGGTRLVANFYASAELGEPLSPLPTEVRIDLEQPGGGSSQATLSPDPKPGVTRFASSSGNADFEVDPLIGTLHVTISGQAVSVLFSGGIR
ncbi:hypothetical protein BH23PLA1_BH23PLA1_21690 [soil metagenome]